VLNSIPIYFMSYMKMPVQLIKKVIRVQREFLWGGVKGGKKLCWVKWKVICQEKRKGGLGVRDIRAVNLSLLTKWRWRLLHVEERSLWKEVLVAKYGDHIQRMVDWSGVSRPYFSSPWWNDICDIENCVVSKNWLGESISRKVGNGARTRFWSDRWFGFVPLCVSYPRLFSIFTQKETSIGEVRILEGEVWGWNLVWRRRLFLWEEESLSHLLASLGDWRPSSYPDSWWWNLAPDGVFSVKSSVESLAKELVVVEPLPLFEGSIFAKIWESPAPSKVIVFSWQLLYDRVPTKSNLAKRGVLQHGDRGNCVWCLDCIETSQHLFLHCKVAMWVWYEVFRWLGVVIVMPPSIFHLFDCLSVAAKNTKVRRGFRLVWHMVIWSIWNARNNFIFNNVKKEPMEIVEDIKVVSWRWSADRLKIPPCLYYEWVWDPGDCCLR
jgi:hypothetical protein